jgi:hypothetical protein
MKSHDEQQQVEVTPGVFKDADELTPGEQVSAEHLQAEMQVMAESLAEMFHRSVLNDCEALLGSAPALVKTRADVLLPPARRRYHELRHRLYLLSIELGEVSSREAWRVLPDPRDPDDLSVPWQDLKAESDRAFDASMDDPEDWAKRVTFLEASRKLLARLNSADEIRARLEEVERLERDRDA